jgi:hypothetical protein
MPCWEIRETQVNLDASTIDRARLVEAGKENSVTVTFEGTTAILTDRYGRSTSTVEGLVKQTYASMTVKAGLLKFGLARGKSLSEERVDGRIRLTLKAGR